MAETSVSPAVKEIVVRSRKSGILSGSFSFKRLMKLLNYCKKSGIKMEPWVMRFKNVSGGFVSFMVIISFFIVFLSVQLKNPMALYFLLAPLFLVWAFKFIEFILARKAVNPDLWQFLIPLLYCLKEDISPSGKIDLNVALSPILFSKVTPDRSKPYRYGRYHEIVDFVYERDFLTLRLPLRDSNEITIKGKETVTKIKLKKKNANYKTKTKYKYRKQTAFTTEITVNNSGLKAKKRLIIPGHKLKKREKNGREMVSIDNKEKMKSSNPWLKSPEYNLVIGSILNLYKLLEKKEHQNVGM